MIYLWWCDQAKGNKVLQGYIEKYENWIKTSFLPKPIDEVLAGKDIILLYSSTEFISRSKKFTSILKTFYKDNCGKGIELFFISDDFDREGMLDCMKKSHGDWYAFEHGSRVGERLKKKFSHGFKTLVVLKPDGTIINEVDIDDIEQNPSIIDECKSM